MAGADSRIRVAIDGDAAGLTRAANTAEREVGGIGKAAKLAGVAIVAGFAADALIDFGRTALAEGDRLGDATARLEEQLGDLAGPLIANAGHFAKLGQSAQDMLELEARIADMGTAAGIADAELAAMTEDAAETAAALALITDLDADSAIDLIGKASTGSARALRDLGINLTDAEIEARALRDTGKGSADALTDNELAAAGLALVLEKLDPRVRGVTEGMGDFEQKSAELEARFETLTGKVGAAVDGPLTDLLGWTISGIEGFELLGGALAGAKSPLEALGIAAQVATIPFRVLLDVIQAVLDAAGQLGGVGVDTGQGPGPGRGGSLSPSGAAPVNLYVQPRDSWETEAAVVSALRDYTNRSGPLI